MGLLDKLFNPVWYKISKLDANRQRIVAAVLCGYDFCRQNVEMELVAPLESFLKTNHISAVVGPQGLNANLKIQLIDEAIVGLCRCFKRPDPDSINKLSSNIVQYLPEVWGIFVLADINHRLQRNSSEVLDQTHYSKDSDEARTQVLVKWMNVLGVTSPSFITQVNAYGFAIAWERMAQSFIGGMLKGLSRSSSEDILSKAEKLAADIPAHRIGLTKNFIERLATVEE